MYGLAYGTLPLVRSVGGLADTVIDASAENGNGFAFGPATVAGLRAALARVLATWADRERWSTLQRSAMRADFGWQASAGRYLALYRDLRPSA
jgi:starch synthase